MTNPAAIAETASTPAIDEEKVTDLRNFVERIERLENEKATIGEDTKAVYQVAKAQGFDTKTIRKIVKLRRTDQRTIQEEEFLLEAYKAALGMEV